MAIRGNMSSNTETTPDPDNRSDGFTNLNEAKALEGRADQLYKKFDCDQANQLLLQALQKRQSVAGPADPSVVKTMERIADIYMRQNKLSEAEKTLAEAAKILEAAYYPGHALLAPVL